MRNLGMGMGFASLLFAGAIFGVFYAWICTTMWGLDAADPRVAIAAMQTMNANVRNMVFSLPFFGTPLVLLLTAAVIRGRAGLFFGAGAAVSLLGNVVLTMFLAVPMNEALALIEVPTDLEAARAIWEAYSPRWQVYNITRTVFCGIALLLAAVGLWRFAQRPLA